MNREKKLYNILALISSGQLGLYEGVSAISELDEEYSLQSVDEDEIDRAYMKWYFGSDDYVIPNPNELTNSAFYDQLNTWRGCAKYLQSHPQESAQEWISVDDRLPDGGLVRIIAFTPTDDITMRYRTCAAVDLRIMKDVTHWKYLSQPTKD